VCVPTPHHPDRADKLPKSQQGVGIALFGLTPPSRPPIGPNGRRLLTDNPVLALHSLPQLVPWSIALALQLYVLDKRR